MKKPIRILLGALVLVAVVLSLPFWLPTVLANTHAAGAVDSGETTLLLWSNEWQPAEGGVQNSPRLVAWQPASGETAWSLDTGYAYGAVLDDASAYLVEDPVRKAYEPQALLQLSIVDLRSGERLSQTALKGEFLANLSSGAPVPILVLGDTLYFTNNRQSANLAAYNLTTHTLQDARNSLCENGYPVEYEYIASQHAILSLCVEFSTDMQTSLTRVSLADGAQQSLPIDMTVDGHYPANGLVVTPDEQVYVLNSGSYTMMQIDVETMQPLRQANYAEAKAEHDGWLERGLAWLLEQAARPAQAKMLFAVTALSPDGSQLAVAGSPLHGNQRELYIVDLDSLQAVQRVRMPGLASQLAYLDSQTVALVYGDSSPWYQLAALDTASGQHTLLAAPAFGYLRSLFVLAGQ
ncbi:MAG: hypothetical protein KF701_02280 [Anaerolineales bacterium]|nr:MAG: hypothetical protein KF701_02280 [Anaerolineales bacterium]